MLISESYKTFLQLNQDTLKLCVCVFLQALFTLFSLLIFIASM